MSLRQWILSRILKEGREGALCSAWEESSGRGKSMCPGTEVWWKNAKEAGMGQEEEQKQLSQVKPE